MAGGVLIAILLLLTSSALAISGKPGPSPFCFAVNKAMAAHTEEARVKEFQEDVHRYRESAKEVLKLFSVKSLKEAEYSIRSDALLEVVRDLAWQRDMAELKFRDRAEYDLSGPIRTDPEWGRDGEPLTKQDILDALSKANIPTEEPKSEGPVEHLWGLELERLAFQYDLWEMQKALQRKNPDWATVAVVALRLNYRLNEKNVDQPTWLREHQDKDWQLARFEPRVGLHWHQEKKDDFRKMKFVLRAVPQRIPFSETYVDEKFESEGNPSQNILRLNGKITRVFPAGFDYTDETGKARTFNINDERARLRKQGLSIDPRSIEIVLRPY